MRPPKVTTSQKIKKLQLFRGENPSNCSEETHRKQNVPLLINRPKLSP